MNRKIWKWKQKTLLTYNVKVLDKRKNQTTNTLHKEEAHCIWFVILLLQMFTDGSCYENGSSTAYGGAAVYISESSALNKAIHIPPPCTNNRAELLAILLALSIAEKHKIQRLIIHSDSKYAIKCCTEWYKQWMLNDWQKRDGQDVENVDLIQKIVNSVTKKNTDVKFLFVKAHMPRECFFTVGKCEGR